MKDNFNLALNGTDLTQNNPGTTVVTPISGRFVDSASLINISFSTTPTLGINTIKITKGDWLGVYGIELIAQDTSSDANKVKIQIPSQNVVSYGKKFTVSSTPHYNPFDGMSGAKTLTQLGDYIDTATSLGMENWKGGTSNYYKPFNGGRVVKWVDSSGTIKTSVTMMPPNAQNIGTTASNAVSDAHIQAGTNDDVVNFNTEGINNSLSEVAKTFHFREFGNGNQNRGDSGSGKDFTVDSGSDKAYVMDDGLTSLTGNDVYVQANAYLRHNVMDGYIYNTFIGTGLTISGETVTHGGTDDWKYYIDGVLVKNYTGSVVVPAVQHIAQNLPYGTHILGIKKDAANTSNEHYKEFSFHQPKMPPIPENACIIADYMLMADFVGIPASTTPAAGLISKGTRFVSPTRDMFYNTPNNSFTFAIGPNGVGGDYPVEGSYIYTGSGTTSVASLPFFGVNVDITKYSSRTILLVDSETSETGVTNPSSVDSGSWNNHAYKTTNLTLGLHTVHHKPNGSNHWNHGGVWVVPPTHTSSHYQTFETPFLHELVGGDRNMEQHNLVVTPDGKTWDEVTRDTSYIGNLCLQSTTDNSAYAVNAVVIFDEWRGTPSSVNRTTSNKYFAIAYDRVICLVDGHYQIQVQTIAPASNSAGNAAKIYINGSNAVYGHTGTGGYSAATSILPIPLKRGDYVQVKGGWYNSHGYSNFSIIKIK